MRSLPLKYRYFLMSVLTTIFTLSLFVPMELSARKREQEKSAQKIHENTKKRTQRLSKRSKDLKKKRKEKRIKRRRGKRQRYTAVKGDSWRSVAQLLKVKLKSLKRWNRRASRRGLKPGQRVVFYGPQRRTESIGLPYRGRLQHGVHLDPDGDGLGRGFAVSHHRPDLWGTPQLVKLIKQCGRTYRRYFSTKYEAIPIGDLSSRHGGPLKKHKSHQSGRDVDIGYMRKKPISRGYFKDTSPKEMNLYAQWVVLKCFLDDPLTQKVFIERARVRALKRYIKRIYKKRTSKLKKYLQFFPGGKKRVISPDKVHKSHMHVRIHCPSGDRKCSG